MTPLVPIIRRAADSVWSRVVAAVLGGYGFAVAASWFLASVLAQTAILQVGDSVHTGLLLSFAFYAAAVIRVLAVRSALRAWAELVLATAVLLGLDSLLTTPGGTV